MVFALQGTVLNFTILFCMLIYDILLRFFNANGTKKAGLGILEGKSLLVYKCPSERSASHLSQLPQGA